METLFEFRQQDLSKKDSVEIIEIKIFENGELFYRINIEGRYKTNETKPQNEKFAECTKNFLERKMKCVIDLPDKLENEKNATKSQYIKIGDKKIFGHDWQRNFDYTCLSKELQNEDQLVQVIGDFKNFIEKFYPNYIAWKEIGENNWFEKPKIYSNYELNDNYYIVCEDKVFTFDEEKFQDVPVTNITASQLKMYGKCNDVPAIELKIKSIKEFESPDWKALISAEDGAGVEISFWDFEYFDHPEDYKIGKIGLFTLWGNIENSPKPRLSKNGVVFTKKEAEKYEEFVYDNEASVKTSEYTDFAFFEPTKDFENSGKYKFRTCIKSVLYASGENGEFLDNVFFGIEIPLMNQIYKENPRWVMAQFDEKNPFKGKLEVGRGLSGVLYFGGRKERGLNICKYGENAELSFDEKYPDTSEWDIEDFEELVDIEDEED